MILAIDTAKLKQEFLDIISDFYGLPDEVDAMDLYLRIDAAIVGSEFFEKTKTPSKKKKAKAKRKRLRDV